MKGIKLSWRFMIGVALIVILVLCVSVVITLNKSTLELRSQLLKSASDIGQFVAHTSHEALLSYDYLSLNHLMKKVSQSENVVYAVVLRNERPITTYVNHQRPEITALERYRQTYSKMAMLLPELRKLDDLKIISFPVQTDSETIAQLELGVSLSRLKTMQKEIIVSRIIEVLMLLGLLALVISLGFHRFVLYPLGAMLNAIKGYTLGAPPVNVKAFRNDELGQLSKALNAMMEEIYTSHSRIKDREQNLSAITESVQEAIVRLDGNGHVVFWNQAAERVFGYSSEQMMGKNLHHYLPIPQFREKAVQAYQVFNQTGTGKLINNTTVVQAVNADGKRIPCELTISALKAESGWHAVAVIRDIQKRIEAEKEQRLAATAFETRDAIVVTDKNGVIVRVNQALLKMSGYQSDEIVGNTPAIFQSGKQDRNFYEQLWKELLEDGFWRGEIWNKRKNGEKYPLLLSISAVTDPQGEVINYVGISSDLSDSYTQKKQIRLLLNATAEGIVGIDKQGYISYINKSALQFLKSFKLPEQVLVSDFLLVEASSLSGSSSLIEHAQRGHNLHEDNANLKTYRGEKIPIEFWLRPVYEEGQFIGSILTFIDITARRKAENELNQTLSHLEQTVDQRTKELVQKIDELERTREELIQSEKMASLGRLVAGFAHEINTPIGVAVTASSLFAEIVPKIKALGYQESLDHKGFNELIENMEESAALTQSSLRKAVKLVGSFKRTAVEQSNLEWSSFNLYEALHDVVDSLQNDFKHTDINITIDCLPGLTVFSQAGSIEQVLSNLLLNSLQHGFNGGKQKGEINIRVKKEGEQLYIFYSDSGIGMDEHTLNRLFEPFYTTARDIGGTGLGLFVCYNLVTAKLHGSISCHSAPAKGTSFEISFPIGYP